MDLTDRKKRILKAVVEDYIRTAEPVGSKAIAQEMGGSVSSATIRNELSDLSDMGYLEQPHTSALFGVSAEFQVHRGHLGHSRGHTDFPPRAGHYRPRSGYSGAACGDVPAADL